MPAEKGKSQTQANIEHLEAQRNKPVSHKSENIEGGTRTGYEWMIKKSIETEAQRAGLLQRAQNGTLGGTPQQWDQWIDFVESIQPELTDFISKFRTALKK